MSMSINVIGIPTRDMFDKMMELKTMCDTMNIGYPKEIIEFFGKLVQETKSCLEHEVLFQKVPHRKYNHYNEEGFEIDVKDIPDNIETIRFYCSW